MTSFTLDATTPGKNVLVVDGVDISDRATGVNLSIDCTDAPQLTIYARAGGTVTGDGIITVVADPSPTDVMAAAASFLESLDIPSVVALVESRFTTMNQSPIALTLDVLAELAREAADG